MQGGRPSMEGWEPDGYFLDSSWSFNNFYTKLAFYFYYFLDRDISDLLPFVFVLLRQEYELKENLWIKSSHLKFWFRILDDSRLDFLASL